MKLSTLAFAYSVCHVPLAVPTLWYTLYTQLLYTKIMYSFLEFENKYDRITWAGLK